MKMVLALLALLLASTTLRAASSEPPVGTFTFVLGNGEGTSIWDVTGDYVITQEISGVEMTLSFQMVQDPDGKLTANGQATFAGPEIVVSGPLSLTGKIRNKSDATEVQLDGKAVAVEGEPEFTAKIKLKLGIDEPRHRLNGSMKGSFKAPGQKQVRFNTDVSTPLPESATGEWTIVLNVEKAGHEYDPDEDYDEEYEGHGIQMRGTATATLSSGMAFPIKGSGVYSKYGVIRVDYDGWGYDEIDEVVGPRETKLNLYDKKTGQTWLLLHGYMDTFDLLRVKGEIAGQKALFP